MSDPYTYYVTKNYFFELDLPYIMISNVKRYRSKIYKGSIGALTGMAYTNSSANVVGTPSLGGVVTSSEGINYMDDHMGGSTSQLEFCFPPFSPPKAECPYNNYYDWMDDPFYTSLRRFNFGVRVKIIVDDDTIPRPTVKKDIASISIPAGYGFTYQIDPSVYFNPGCSYLKAKQQKTSGAGIASSSQLPYWITYFEGNSTFVLYPPDSTLGIPAVSLVLKCCNMIDECIDNTFSITPYNTKPTMIPLPQTSYTL